MNTKCLFRRNYLRFKYGIHNKYFNFHLNTLHTLVMVRLDYCNALLCGAREDVIRQRERLQRQAARVVCKKYKNGHTGVTELMWDLHGCQYVLVFNTKYCSLCTWRSLMALQHIWLI